MAIAGWAGCGDAPDAPTVALVPVPMELAAHLKRALRGTEDAALAARARVLDAALAWAS